MPCSCSRLHSRCDMTGRGGRQDLRLLLTEVLQEGRADVVEQVRDVIARRRVGVGLPGRQQRVEAFELSSGGRVLALHQADVQRARGRALLEGVPEQQVLALVVVVQGRGELRGRGRTRRASVPCRRRATPRTSPGSVGEGAAEQGVDGEHVGGVAAELLGGGGGHRASLVVLDRCSVTGKTRYAGDDYGGEPCGTRALPTRTRGATCRTDPLSEWVTAGLRARGRPRTRLERVRALLNTDDRFHGVERIDRRPWRR